MDKIRHLRGTQRDRLTDKGKDRKIDMISEETE